MDARKLSRLQSVTGVAVSTFTAAHIINLYAAPAGGVGYDEAQHFFRAVYQQRAVEIGLLAAIAVHGVASVWKNRKLGESVVNLDLLKSGTNSSNLLDRVHRTSGGILLLITVPHILYVRVWPEAWHLAAVDKSGLLAESMKGARKFVVAPYYVLFASAGLLHMATGLIKAKRSLFLSHSRASSFASTATSSTADPAGKLDALNSSSTSSGPLSLGMKLFWTGCAVGIGAIVVSVIAMTGPKWAPGQLAGFERSLDFAIAERKL